jgi:hypothetical protein
MDNENAEGSDDSTSESTAEKMRSMQAAHILNALVTERGLNNKDVTPASAPKTKQKKKPPVTASLTGGTGISTQKRPLAPSEVPTSKKARKTFTEELLKEVSKFMAKQNVMQEGVKAKSKKVPVKQNVRLQNWKSAMRRNVQPGQVKKALLPFTIRPT